MTREKLIQDLPNQMRSLYETGDYYVSIPPGKTPDYEEAYWETVVDPDGKERNRLEEREQFLGDIGYVLEYVKTLRAGNALDIGCGLGWFLSALPEGWKRYGLEVSNVAAEHARKYGEIFTGPLDAHPYEENMFDLVFFHHVVEHLEVPEDGIRAIRKILKPGGTLILGTPDFDSGCARRYKENFRLLHDATHIRLFSNDSMHRFLRDHGFTIERVEYPYFDTRFFSEENLKKLFDTSTVSPPFYGNFMTFFARKAS